MRNLMIIVLVVIVATISCSRDKNPLESQVWQNQSGFLSIQTEHNSYTWKKGEGGYHVYLDGIVKNNSVWNIYSKVSPNPEFVALDEPLCAIAGNSWGQVEKYNATTDSWEETTIEGMLIEGSCFMTLKSAATYSINAPLGANHTDDRVPGLYRIVIEYTFEQNPDDNVKILRDYSNTFEIN